MFWDKNNKRKLNILLVIICALLLCAFGGILVSNAIQEQKESERLSELAGDQQTGIEDYEKVQERAAEIAEQSQEEETEQSAGSSQESQEDTSGDSQQQEVTDETKQKGEDTQDADNAEEAQETITETAAADEVNKAEGIVCWGDDLINGEASNTTSYMAVLGQLLTDNGYELPVINKTLQGGGTLSMMTMAGVDDEIVQGYITKHQQAAGGKQLYVTETGIRDLTEEQTTRNDLECIPVIFMGYYGGWNHDPAELAEQQENILNTFPDKDKFIIVATRPVDGSVSTEQLDQVMSEKWGDHYISLASVTSSAASTTDGQKAMAEAIFQKLQDLGYISKD